MTGEKRLGTILSALSAELERQGAEPGGRLRVSGRLGHGRYALEGEIDLDALAGAVNEALAGRARPGPQAEGRKPEELNAANDL